MDYSKYKFNYFDVVKRHERIINRPKDWEIKVLAIIMLILTFVYTFTNFGFCSEVEDVTTTKINGLLLSTDYNYYTNNNGSSVTYFYAEKGYIYHIFLDMTYGRISATSSAQPALNVPYTLLHTFGGGETYNYIPTDSCYVGLGTSDSWHVTRERIPGQESAVDDLVNNVGVNQMWGVFENGIDFVGVVVLVAFGLFLVVLAIKKVSKGKSEF